MNDLNLGAQNFITITKTNHIQKLNAASVWDRNFMKAIDISNLTKKNFSELVLRYLKLITKCRVEGMSPLLIKTWNDFNTFWRIHQFM